jgi:hypothetical protein
MLPEAKFITAARIRKAVNISVAPVGVAGLLNKVSVVTLTKPDMDSGKCRRRDAVW